MLLFLVYTGTTLYWYSLTQLEYGVHINMHTQTHTPHTLATLGRRSHLLYISTTGAVRTHPRRTVLLFDICVLCNKNIFKAMLNISSSRQIGVNV